MRRNRGRTAILVACGVAALSGTGTAMAVTVYEGYDYAYTPSSNGSYAQACDRETDGHSVYAHYYRVDGVLRKVEVFNGNGHCQNSDTSEANPVSTIRACENVPFAPDYCSSWVSR